MTIEEKKNFLINVAYFLLFIVAGYLIYKFLLPPCLPFIIAFLISSFVNSLLKKFNSKFLKKYKVVAISLMIIVYCFIFFLTISVLSLITVWITNLAQVIPSLYKNYLESWLIIPDKIYGQLPEELTVFYNSLISSLPTELTEIIKTLSSYILSFVTSILTTAPSILVFILLILISSFFIIIDYENIINSINNVIPIKIKEYLSLIKIFLDKKLWVVIKSYLKIMLITFIELSIGLSIINKGDYIGWAALISIVDILPVLGVGTILIPWGIIFIFIGNTAQGWGLLLLYLIIALIRNIIEPKLVGVNLGLHPIITLILMFVGLDLFGILGLFLLPITISCLIFIKNNQPIEKVA